MDLRVIGKVARALVVLRRPVTTEEVKGTLDAAILLVQPGGAADFDSFGVLGHYSQGVECG